MSQLPPATPKDPRHDAACPWCGEPFKRAKTPIWKVPFYRCARCSGAFLLMGKKYLTEQGKQLAAWVGDPL